MLDLNPFSILNLLNSFEQFKYSIEKSQSRIWYDLFNFK